MNPLDFLKTAKSLKDSAYESDIRTSIGRSYYGVFLYFRERLALKGLAKEIKPNRDAHDFLIQCLSFCQETRGAKASSQIKDLRQMRHNADYDLQQGFTATDSCDALMLAEKIILDYKNITTHEETNLIKNAKQHAKHKNWVH